MFKIITQNNLDILKDYLKSSTSDSKYDINEKEKDTEKTAIFYAVMQENIEILNFLLDPKMQAEYRFIRPNINSQDKAGLTPLQWAHQSPDIHDKNIHNTKLNTPIDETIQRMCIIEMYETLRPGLGDRAWVAISKRLKAEGYESTLVDTAIDHAILKYTD